MSASSGTKKDKMLVKFENKSNRVKGLAFHPKRPWILASLHNGVIQLWDYRMETLIDTFEEHDGPVRGIHFHGSQPLFVSGGDDYKIKVWNYQLKRCLFQLLGHLDYIRTVQFHHEYPWVLSASDDQTIRIWNWQSRTCLSVLTGHNHYVMCAQFHPKEDFVLSASLDQTVRVWDVFGLRKKTVSISQDFNASASLPSSDIFGGSDVVVKHVLEGHQRGVNWASFHKQLSLIVSGADDREVKLWRMNDAKAWEVDTMRGHVNNVSCVLFHPKKELIVSNSEDKSIRVWDISKQQSPIVLRRDNDRYWILDAHPTLNLLAAGHDSGMVVFKLHRERPPFDSQKSCYFYKDQYIYEYVYKTGRENPILSTRRRGSMESEPRTLSYNSSNKSQHCVLLSNEDNYELYTFPKGEDGGEKSESARGFAKCAVFVSRNRFAILDKSRTVWLKNLKNETKKRLTIPNPFVNHIFPGGIGRLLLRTADSMILYDIQAQKVVAEMLTQSRYHIKYVVWSRDDKYIAMFSKANIYIATSGLQELCSIHENTRIKSGAWDDMGGVFVYTTATHIKYLLPNGDSGIIRTLDVPVYITAVRDNVITFLDREINVGTLKIDSTEYRFKVALMKRRNKDVLRIMESKKLVGQSIISYLQKKGYPEVALHFVKDEKIRFELALECGNINIALECASSLDNPECWHKLGVEALRQGNHQVVEAAYQKTKNFERLSFLYLITGNIEKLSKMLHIATLRNDLMGRFHNALYLGNVEERVTVLKDAGQIGLAMITAQAHGLDDHYEALKLEFEESVPENLPIVDKGDLLFPPNPLLKGANWPLLEVRSRFLEESTPEDKDNFRFDVETKEEEEEEQEEEEEAVGTVGDFGMGWGDGGLDDLGVGGDDDAPKEEASGGWGGGFDDLDIPLDDVVDAKDGGANTKEDEFFMVSAGKSARQKWSQNSTLAGDMVAAGAFDMAMHYLNRQVGIVNFAPLKPLFLAIYKSATIPLPLFPGSSTLESAMQRQSSDPDTKAGTDLPLLCITLQHCTALVNQGYQAVTEGKFIKAKRFFQDALHAIPFLVLSSQSEFADVKALIVSCRQYVTAIRLELARKEAEKDKVRQAALAAYFTHCDLKPVHLILGLRGAVKCSYTIQNFKTTAVFCRRILELAVSSNNPKIAQIVNPKQIRGVLKVCESKNTDAKPLDYSDSKHFFICCASLTPVYSAQHLSKCPYCDSGYKKEFEETVCETCKLGKIGAQASGLKVVSVSSDF